VPELQWKNLVALEDELVEWGSLIQPQDGPDPVAYLVAGRYEPLQRLASLAARSGDGLIAEAGRVDESLAAELRQAGFRIVRREGEEAAESRVKPRPGRHTLLTSGTTGRPKLVEHTLDTLATMPAVLPPRRWLNPYSPGTYAWYQLAVLGLTVPGQTLVPATPEDWQNRAERFEVDAISATPTFWRQALLGLSPERLGALRLTQITLGGEPVDQRLLDRLAATYPEARLTHIYASTEAGACIAVSDGRAGFPADWLNREGEGVGLRVEDGRLFVRSPWAASGRSGWIDTGDAVRERDGRVEIVGRAESALINVGGAKVDAIEVAHALESHPAVAWARVYARRSPLVGELAAADVRLAADATEAELAAWCRDRLPEPAIPRRFRFVDEIPAGLSLKADA
jgi:acyl-coenzyme A synthetase/AMP-(fatty) acid ligase